MTFGNRIRFVAAGLLGVLVDLLVMQDAYGYSIRMKQSHSGALIAGLATMLLVTAFLNFGPRRAFAIAATVWLGMIAAHTWILIVEVSKDPTSHNLWPFEYLLLSVLWTPTLLGATAGSVADRIRNLRTRNNV